MLLLLRVRLIDNPAQPAILAPRQPVLVLLAQLRNPRRPLALVNLLDAGEIVHHLAVGNVRHDGGRVVRLAWQMRQVPTPDVDGGDDEKHDAEDDQTRHAAEEELVLELAGAVGETGEGDD